MRIPLLLSVLFLSGCSHMANDNWSGQMLPAFSLQRCCPAPRLCAASGMRWIRRAIGADVFSHLEHQRTVDSRPAGSGTVLESILPGTSPAQRPYYAVADGALLKSNAFPFAMQHQGNNKGQCAHYRYVPEECRFTSP